MGITVSYRGSIADLDRIEDLEDRVIDLSLEVGANAQIWRSVCDDDPRRVVRGVILDLYPGQETTSLLISPEGWLINLSETSEYLAVKTKHISDIEAVVSGGVSSR